MVGYQRSDAGYRRMLAALFLAGIATFAQLYAPQALLPQLARDFHVGAAASALVISAATVGLAVGVIPWSLVSDRVGRVRAMSVALVAATAFGLLGLFAPAFPVLLTARVCEGLCIGGVPGLAIAYLSEEIAPTFTARAAGTYIAGTTIGGLLGRLLAGPVSDFAGWRIGVLTVLLVCAASAVGFIVIAPAPQQPLTRGTSLGDLGRALLHHLRSRRQLALYAQGFLLMGGFVAMYNYLGFRLEAAPFGLSAGLISLVFLAYLAGTWSSAQAGVLASRWGRRTVLLSGAVVMIAGVAITLAGTLVLVLIGLVIATAGFFAAHAIASGWTGQDAGSGRAQAAALYNLGYYAGSSLFGWAGGLAFTAADWNGTALMITCLALAAALIALTLPRRM